jgi:hypothetical protein
MKKMPWSVCRESTLRAIFEDMENWKGPKTTPALRRLLNEVQNEVEKELGKRS